MATRTVIMAVTTRKQGEPTTNPFRFELLRAADRALMSFVEQHATTVAFPEVPEGAEYVAMVSRNGVTAERLFAIPISPSDDVPDVITVTF